MLSMVPVLVMELKFRSPLLKLHPRRWPPLLLPMLEIYQRQRLAMLLPTTGLLFPQKASAGVSHLHPLLAIIKLLTALALVPSQVRSRDYSQIRFIT